MQRNWRQLSRKTSVSKKKVQFEPDWLRGRTEPCLEDFRGFIEAAEGGKDVDAKTWGNLVLMMKTFLFEL